MFWSKSDFFKQSKLDLKFKRDFVSDILNYKGLKNDYFLKAYDYFVVNPTEFDGATIIKDLNDIQDLDLSALVHDYQYIVELPKHKGLKWLKEKTKMDWLYGRNMELLGKGIWTPYLRAILLILITPIYCIIVKSR